MPIARVPAKGGRRRRLREAPAKGRRSGAHQPSSSPTSSSFPTLNPASVAYPYFLLLITLNHIPPFVVHWFVQWFVQWFVNWFFVRFCPRFLTHARDTAVAKHTVGKSVRRTTTMCSFRFILICIRAHGHAAAWDLTNGSVHPRRAMGFE